LELTPLPNSPSFTVDIQWHNLPWRIRDPKEVEEVDESGQVLRRVPLEMSGGEIHLTTASEPFAYRIR
jgi:hypothetical protein